MKDKSTHLIFSVLTVLAIVLAFVFITNPESFVFAAAPTTPANLVATPGDGQVVLTWSLGPKSAAVQKYYIQHDNPNTTIDTGSVGTFYTVSGLTNGVEYTFSVAALNKDGISSYTSGVVATPVISGSVPGAPTLVSATPNGDQSLEIIWTAPADNGGDSITNYEIGYNPQGGASGTTDVGNVTSATLTGLVNGTQYGIKVRAQNGVGYSTDSNGLAATPVAGVTAPEAPTLGVLTPGNGVVQVAWVAPVDNGGEVITDYTISYTLQEGSEQTVNTNGITSPYQITGLTNGVEYTIKIAAENSEGLGDYSTTNTSTPFSVPENPTNLSLTSGDGTVGISWAAPASNGSPITDYTISYTQAGGSEQTVSLGSASTSYTLEGLTNGVNYTIKVSAENSAGTSSYSSTATQAPDQNVAPAIVGVPTVIVSNTGAVVAWSTNKAMSTRLDFGLIGATTSTSEVNKETRVVSHSTTISNLIPCTTYSYQVYSKDSLNQTAVSSVETFATSGCEGEATVVLTQRDTVDTSVGGELDFTNTNIKVKLSVPANLKEGKTDVVFQAKKLDKAVVQSELGLPEIRKRWLGDYVYKLTAYASETEKIDGFDNPVGVTIEYSREDVSGIDINTLVIYHYEEDKGWRILESCVNNYNSNSGVGEISCPTPDFSIFGLFGEASSGSSTSGSYISDTSVLFNNANKDEDEIILEDQIIVEVSDTVDDKDIVSNDNFVKTFFNSDLWYGNNNADVFALQKFLNANGFTLSQEGPGSPGRETSYFGNKTFEAVKRFQKEYADNILNPLGLNNPTGYFGYFTRTFINQNY